MSTLDMQVRDLQAQVATLTDDNDALMGDATPLLDAINILKDYLAQIKELAVKAEGVLK